MYDKKWIKVMALAMGLPSTILFTSWLLMQLASSGVISKTVAIIMFLLIVFNILYLMVAHGFKRKD